MNGGIRMYVKNHMLPKDKLTTLRLDENLGSALEKINQGSFLSLPVVDGDKFKGYLMKESIYRNYFENDSKDKEKFLENAKVIDLYNAIF